MTTTRRQRPRDPAATREIILEAARTRLAQDGPEGLSLVEVANLARPEDLDAELFRVISPALRKQK